MKIGTKACCNRSYGLWGEMVDEPLCETCAHEYFVKLKLTAFMCLRRVGIVRDVARLICQYYLDNPFVMNPVSYFIEDVCNDPFLIVIDMKDALHHALRCTQHSVAFYPSTNPAAHILIIENGEAFPIQQFFTELIPHVRKTRQKVIICGEAEEGFIEVVPNIVSFVKCIKSTTSIYQ